MIEQNNNLIINKNSSHYGASFSVLAGGSIALSEISVIPLECAQNYFELITNVNLLSAIKTVSANASQCCFYNRLNVPERLRGQGIGKALLHKTLEYCAENNILLINTANSYGDMDQNNLIKFYQENGMTLIHKEGLLAYHKDLELGLKNNKSNKSRVK